MREVLFRGKSIDTNTWVYGFYCRYGHAKQEKSYIIPDYASTLCVVEIIPGTLGQYIGLTDKNGTKIFEGDIVHAVYQSNYIGCKNIDFGIGVVKYEGSYYGGAAYGIDIIGESGLRIFTASLEHGTEVIGNIYDDPKPLKGE